MDTDVSPHLTPLVVPASAEGALAMLSAPARTWFSERHRSPTMAQRLAWPTIREKRHFLLSAPTGSGKTLAAFLPLLDDLLASPIREGTRVLYVAPLRALVNDIRANLASYLAELPGGATLRVASRTGDTAASQRRRLLEAPPDVLLTTPESLALLLVHPQADRCLGGVEWVIVDEAHQLAGNKRGADLALSLERLEWLTPRPPCRIGLSATCAPLEEVARWLAGTERAVALAVARDEARIRLKIEHLDLAPTDRALPGYVVTLLEKLVPLLEANRTTLIFTNVRSIGERLTWSLRRRLPHWDDAIALHHSALSVAARREVERRMKAGELRVVVSSTSLELGIDVGSVDLVVLIHPPGGAARLLQRLGRSGHAPGRQRKGVQFTANLVELLEAVATASAGDAAQLEPLCIPRHPLDVLAQQLLGMSMGRPVTAASAWRLVRQAYPYRHLSLADFAECLAYLSGGRMEMPLPARVRWVDERFVVRGHKTAAIYRTNAGTIYEEETRDVRAADDGRHLGQVPDGFATRLLPGDRFLLEGRALEVTKGDAAGLEVRGASGIPVFTRWAGRLWSMPPELAERIWLLRVRCKEALRDGVDRALELLQREYHLEAAAASALVGHLRRQEDVSAIPATGLLVERSPGLDGWGRLFAFHVPLPTPACEAIARVLAYRLGRSGRFQYVPGWLGFGLAAPEQVDLSPGQLGELLAPDGFRADLERVVMQSPALRDRFTRVAATGLMVLRQPLGKRRRVGGRDWAGRRLLGWLRGAEPRFPLLRQALRELTEDDFRVDLVESYLARLRGEPIHVRPLAAPSPIVASWKDANFHAYDNYWAHLAAPPRDVASPRAAPSIHLPGGLLVANDWLLTPHRAAIHVPTRMAVVADLHLGYDSSRRAGGDALPLFGWHDTRSRLEALLDQYGVRGIVLAGDLAEDGRHAQEIMDLIDWLVARQQEVVLVPGNHDARLPPLDGVRVCHERALVGDWVVRHDVDVSDHRPQVVGHVHPMVHGPRVGGRAACYVLAGHTLVLPAFSDDAAGLDVASVRHWRDAHCFAIVNDEVWDLGQVRDLPRPTRLFDARQHARRTTATSLRRP